MPVQLKETTFATGVSDVLAALDADGAVIVHEFLEPDTLARLRSDMRASAEGRAFGSTSANDQIRHFWGDKTMRFTRLAARSDAFFDVLTHPGYLAVADALLLPNCGSYWMNTGQMMILAPGQAAQALHRDGANWGPVLRPGGIEVTVSCMFALEDFTIANGATNVVPGSHRWDDYGRKATASEMTQAVMPAGSGMIYTGRVIHGGGANTTDQWRWGMHLSFVVGWLTPEEALPLAAPWETVRAQPRRVQQLLGWRSTTIGGGNAHLWTVDYDDVPVGLDLS